MARHTNKAVEQTCASILRGGLCACVCVCGPVGATISSSVTREGGGGWRGGQRDRSDNRLSDSDKLSSNGSACPSPPLSLAAD